jgi:secondary thiamine-phosphate synthase enzyme
MHSFEVESNQKQEFISITQKVQELIQQNKYKDGAVVIYVPHTTAGITINESADPSVKQDILGDLTRLVPKAQSYYEHYEGNSAAHTMASLMGSSSTVLIENGRLLLGRWQGIYFCEFDGPRRRKVYVSG